MQMRWKRRYALTSVWKTDMFNHLQDRTNYDRDLRQLFPDTRKASPCSESLLVEVEDSESDSDLSGSEWKRESWNLFVAATSDRIND